MSTQPAAKGPGRCHHCGLEVVETRHTRAAYQVGYYELCTGDVEPATLTRRDDPSAVITVLRLVRSAHVLTCAACYARTEIRAVREGLFRPERGAADREAVP